MKHIFNINDCELVTSIFMSSFTSGLKTDAQIPNTLIGYLTELDKMGQSSTVLGIESGTATEYNTVLRPVTDLSFLTKNSHVWLKSINFKCYDTTLTGSSNQDSTVLTDISSSLTLDNDSYVQTKFRYSELFPDFQPNYFRPFVKIGKKIFFGSLNKSNYGNKNNKGDMSIGLPIRTCLNFNEPLFIDHNINNGEGMKVTGQVCQYVNGKLQRYPLLCIIETYVKK